jgi:hypothetical protein
VALLLTFVEPRSQSLDGADYASIKVRVAFLAHLDVARCNRETDMPVRLISALRNLRRKCENRVATRYCAAEHET